MNKYGGEKAYCCFHPKEVVIGVCHLCLNERLLILASNLQSRTKKTSTATTQSLMQLPSSTLPKIFTLGSLLGRLELRHRRQRSGDYKSNDYASTSQEDSFISMKFGDNGVASWEKGKVVSKVSLEDCNVSWSHSKSKEIKSVVEPRGGLTWRKRIGGMFQLIRWKRSNKGNAFHVGSSKLEGVKGRYGWIRTLTRRRTKE